MGSKWVIGGVLAVVFSAGAAAGAVLQQASQTRREPQFDNEDVRVWKSIVMPNQPLTLHRHEHGRTIVALKGGKLDIVDAKGQTKQTMNWESGKGLAGCRSGRRAARRPRSREGTDRGHGRRDAQVKLPASVCVALFWRPPGRRPFAARRRGRPPANAATPFDVTEKSIEELQRAMQARDVTSRQLVDLYLARIEAYDKQGPALNAIVA